MTTKMQFAEKILQTRMASRALHLSVHCFLFCLSLAPLSSGYTYIIESGIPNCDRRGVDLFCKLKIPQHIPDGVTKVHIEEYSDDTIASDMFHGTNWRNILSLSISSLTIKRVAAKSGAFRTLTNITDLGLHGNMMFLENDTFNGIKELVTLDLSFCRSIDLPMFLGALNGTKRIRHLQNLTISQISQYSSEFEFGEVFSKVTGSKNISTILARDIPLKLIDFTAVSKYLCNSLTYLDLSYTFVASFTTFDGICTSLKRLDVNGMGSGIVLPFALPANLFIPMNLTNENMMSLVASVQILNARKFFAKFPILRNLTIFSLSDFIINIKNLVLSNNGMQYIDMQILNVKNSLEHLDISSNDLVFLQVQLFGVCWLKTINLSKNNLNQMAKYNSTRFRILFKNCTLLEKMNISSNHLSYLPDNMFANNRNLEILDLSNNDLVQVDFTLKNNQRLLKLVLRQNNITMLSASSINRLQLHLSNQDQFVTDLRNNPLHCNACNNKNFISWIVKSRKNVITDGCIGENGIHAPIDESTVRKLEKVCDREARIILVTSTTTGSVLVSILVFILAVTLWKSRKKRVQHKQVLEQFQKGEAKFEFPVFLAYCGEDEDFVSHYVKTPLAKHLRELIGVDRDLICTGDRHFKPGHTIAEQTSCCCDRSSVVILVVSPSFCASNHCTYEAHIAFTMGKPMILMFKEYVTLDEMPPALRVIFKQFTRITWKKNGDDYVMPTTWQNIGQSILDLSNNNGFVNPFCAHLCCLCC